ncbi:hypothetical protein H0H92_014076 [Tricholoma furcatifolium]|nr:hypothetical protein H0H92_014076 [Tricholoma furcatifolium]
MDDVEDYKGLQKYYWQPTPSANFLFSIIAGVEKGTKNRYRHIWPFEHTHVCLYYPNHAQDNDNDYVNASYVQPPASTSPPRPP